MKIYDHTKTVDNVNALAEQLDEIIIDGMRKTSFFNAPYMLYRFQNDHHEENLKAVLQDVPVFLVTTEMGGVAITTPYGKVTVPHDRYAEVQASRAPYMNNEKSIVGEECFEDEISQQEQAFYDPHGVYIYHGHDLSMPRQIFIWTDKIALYTESDLHGSTYTPAQKESMRLCLMKLAICQQYSHALMDTELYDGVAPWMHEAKENNVVMRNIYETTSALALALCFILDDLYGSVRLFIERYVKSLPEELSCAIYCYCGMQFYCDDKLCPALKMMLMKHACRIETMEKRGDDSKLLNYYFLHRYIFVRRADWKEPYYEALSRMGIKLCGYQIVRPRNQ